MKKREKETLPEDTVARMDVDGMPWSAGRPGRPKRRQEEVLPSRQEELTGEERRTMIWIALKAALLVAAVFGLAAFLLILFCVKVWLRP